MSSATSTKKPRRAAAALDHTHACTVGLESLPFALADAILDFVVAETPFYQGKYKPDSASAYAHALEHIAFVCKAWRSVVRRVVGICTLRSLALTFKFVSVAGRREMLVMRRRAILHRSWTQRLTVLLTPRISVASPQQHWAALLSHTPFLHELHVCDEFKGSPHVIRAAAEQCPMVETLVVPARHSLDKCATQLMLAAVFESASVWLQKSNQRGLVRLCVELGELVAKPKRAIEYIANVAKTCPNLNTFDGYRSGISVVSRIGSSEQWMVDLETWRLFCQTCTQLCAFNWICVPFATSYFEIFGQFAKPSLTTLVLTTPCDWDWETFIRKVDHQATKRQLETKGYGPTATNVLAVLRACPQLEQLDVDWYFPTQRFGTLEHNMMNAAIFGDEFCEAVAQNCPRLMTLDMSQRYAYSYDAQTMESFTDRSLRALASLYRLHHVVLGGCHITGAGLFCLVMRATQNGSATYKLRLGDSEHGAASVAFCVAVHGFLELLARHDGPLPFGSSRVVLHVVDDNKEGSMMYIDKELTTQIRTKFPAVVIKALSVKSYGPIREFLFSTDAAHSSKYEWVHLGGDDRYDNDDDGVHVYRYHDGGDSDDSSSSGDRTW